MIHSVIWAPFINESSDSTDCPDKAFSHKSRLVPLRSVTNSATTVSFQG